MPAVFTYPADRAVDVWIPLSYLRPRRTSGASAARDSSSVIARMKPGVTPAQLQTELAAVAARLARKYPDNPGWTDVYGAPRSATRSWARCAPLLVLLAAVAMVLLITCVNIASLLLARATGRQRELAMRAALGAGAGRIARQLLTESLTLALAGGVLGVVARRVWRCGRSARRAARSCLAPARSGWTAWSWRSRLGISLLSGLLFGLVPVFRASSGDLRAALRAGARGSVGVQGSGCAARWSSWKSRSR